MEGKQYPKDKRFIVFEDGTIIGVKGHPLTGSYDNSGYRHVMLGKSTNEKVSRIVAFTWVHNPNPKEYNYVNHKNGIKTDDRACNLEWCTHAQNLKHASDTGLFLSASGSKHYLSKIDESQVYVIKHLFNDGLTDRQIATYFKVDRQTIRPIRKGITWKHVVL